MVVLSAAVTTKAGKPLVARQFVEMTRLRIEGLLAAFPKLLGAGNAQHTFIDTENVRYLYQPLDSTLYLVLITNKASNLLEDLDTVRLLSKVCTDMGASSEENVADVAFDLVFAFDEVITTGGYREHVTRAGIRTNLAMESHEEKLHNMIRQSKLETAREEMQRKARAIRVANREGGGGGMGGMGGMGGGGMSGMGGGGMGGGGMGGGGMGGGGGMSDPTPRAPAPAPAAAAERAPVIKSSMKLGGGDRSANLMSMMAAEDNLTVAPAPAPAAGAGAAAAPAPAAAAAASTEPATLTVEERISVTLNREGGVEAMEVKGALALTANTEEARFSRVQLALGANPDFTFQTNPKMAKAAFENDRVLELKNASAGFPAGRAAGVLRWMQRPAPGSAVAPISINCWPEEEGNGEINVNIEYTLNATQLTMHDVRVVVPLDSGEVPTINSVDGNFQHDPRAQTLTWQVDVIDASNASGSLDFNVRSRDTEGFFPVRVQFTTLQSTADIDVVQVSHVESGAAVPHSLSRTMVADNYQVE